MNGQLVYYPARTFASDGSVSGFVLKLCRSLNVICQVLNYFWVLYWTFVMAIFLGDKKLGRQYVSIHFVFAIWSFLYIKNPNIKRFAPFYMLSTVVSLGIVGYTFLDYYNYLNQESYGNWCLYFGFSESLVSLSLLLCYFVELFQMTNKQRMYQYDTPKFQIKGQYLYNSEYMIV